MVCRFASHRGGPLCLPRPIFRGRKRQRDHLASFTVVFDLKLLFMGPAEGDSSVRRSIEEGIIDDLLGESGRFEEDHRWLL